jgi:hypothetical protein
MATHRGGSDELAPRIPAKFHVDGTEMQPLGQPNPGFTQYGAPWQKVKVPSQPA